MRYAVPLAVIGALAVSPRLAAQNPPAAPAANPPLEVGAVAPDFALRGATRFGTIREPVRLSDYRGKTIVLAFFFRARTRG